MEVAVGQLFKTLSNVVHLHHTFASLAKNDTGSGALDAVADDVDDVRGTNRPRSGMCSQRPGD